MSTPHGRISEQARRRAFAGELILRGFDNDTIVDVAEVSLSSVKRWRAKIQSDGLQGLARKPHSLCHSKIDDEQKNELKAIILKGAKAAGYFTDRWTTRIVADLILKKWDVQYSRSQVSRILHGLGLSVQKPDVKSKKRSQAAIDHWRRHVWPQLKKKRTKMAGR